MRTASLLPRGSGSSGAQPSRSGSPARKPSARLGSQSWGVAAVSAPRAHIPNAEASGCPRFARSTSQKPEPRPRAARVVPASAAPSRHPARSVAPSAPLPGCSASPGPARRGWAGRPASEGTATPHVRAALQQEARARSVCRRPRPGIPSRPRPEATLPLSRDPRWEGGAGRALTWLRVRCGRAGTGRSTEAPLRSRRRDAPFPSREAAQTAPTCGRGEPNFGKRRASDAGLLL